MAHWDVPSSLNIIVTLLLQLWLRLYKQEVVKVFQFYIKKNVFCCFFSLEAALRRTHCYITKC